MSILRSADGPVSAFVEKCRRIYVLFTEGFVPVVLLRAHAVDRFRLRLTLLTLCFQASHVMVDLSMR